MSLENVARVRERRRGTSHQPWPEARCCQGACCLMWIRAGATAQTSTPCRPDPVRQHATARGTTRARPAGCNEFRTGSRAFAPGSAAPRTPIRGWGRSGCHSGLTVGCGVTTVSAPWSIGHSLEQESSNTIGNFGRHRLVRNVSSLRL